MSLVSPLQMAGLGHPPAHGTARGFFPLCVQAQACTNPSTQLNFDPQPDLSLGGGKTRENTERGCASNRNIPKPGRSGTLIPAAHTDTALPTPALPQGAHGSFLPHRKGQSWVQSLGSAPQEGAFPSSIPQAGHSPAAEPALPCLPLTHTGSSDNYRENQGKSQF